MCREKDKERLAVLARIDEYERKRWFNKDVENDPPTIPLTADKVDYLQKKLKNKILSYFINTYTVFNSGTCIYLIYRFLFWFWLCTLCLTSRINKTYNTDKGYEHHQANYCSATSATARFFTFNIVSR